jgi:hypothetical protein
MEIGLFHCIPCDRHKRMRNGLAWFVVVIMGSRMLSCCSGWDDTPLFQGRLRSHKVWRQRCLLGESSWHPKTHHDVAHSNSLTLENDMLHDMASMDSQNLQRQEEESGDGAKHSWTDEEFEAWILSELSSHPLAKTTLRFFPKLLGLSQIGESGSEGTKLCGGESLHGTVCSRNFGRRSP